MQIWDVEGTDGGAGSKEGSIAQPWDKRQLFGAIPLTAFLAEDKDGLACWEQLFFPVVLPGPVSLCRQVVLVPQGCR